MDAGGVLELPARRAQPLHDVVRHAARAVHDERLREAVRNLDDALVVDVGSPFALIRAVRGPDGDREIVRAALLHKPLRFIGLGEDGVLFRNDDVLLDAAKPSDLRLDGRAHGVRRLDYALRLFNIRVLVLVRLVDHHRGEPIAERTQARFIRGAVV